MPSLSESQRAVLKDLARKSIEYTLKTGKVLIIDLPKYEPALQKRAATFVTLERQSHLRGCIGELIAREPLVLSVVQNAYNAAFEDPRFESLREEELGDLEIFISVLSDPEPVLFIDEEDLLKKIRPGVDGLILTEKNRRGTFLPSVWEEVPEPGEFLLHLKQKAGLPPDYWSPTIRIERYTTEYF